MKHIRLYAIGLGLSLVVTLAAFWLVEQHTLGSAFALSRTWLMTTLVLLATLQLVVQLYCFLHIGQEEKPQWNTAVLGYTVVIIGILVGGTLWIMSHLDHSGAGLSEIYPSGIIAPHTQDD